MKIISPGNPRADRVFKATCQNCKAIIEFSQSEGKVVYDQRDGNYVSVKCPCCQSAINVNL